MIPRAGIQCGECGTGLFEDPSNPVEERSPCPFCGSTRRHFSTGIHETAFTDVSVSWQKLPKPTQQLFALMFLAAILGFLRSAVKRPNEDSGKRLVMAPGSRVLSVIRVVYSPAAIDRVFEPIVADWRVEYFEALKNESKWKARWISARYSMTLLKAIGLFKLLSGLTRLLTQLAKFRWQ